MDGSRSKGALVVLAIAGACVITLCLLVMVALAISFLMFGFGGAQFG